MEEHYFSKTPKAKLKLRKIKAKIRGRFYEFITAPSVFSAKKIDDGTKLLAEKMIVNERDKVLDLGCGYGVLGIVAATLTKNKVYMVDINKRACKLAKLNSSNLKNVIVLNGNMFDPVKDKKFDVILLNPPQTAGKKICIKMIAESKNFLKKSGKLELVARHKKGGKILSEEMFKVFGNLKVIAKKGGYRIYVSENENP